MLVGGGVRSAFTLSAGGDTIDVLAVNLFIGSTDYLVRLREETFIITEASTPLIDSLSEYRALPSAVNAFFNLDSTKLQDNSFVASDLTTAFGLGSTAQVQSGGKWQINVSGPGGSQTSDFKWIDCCEGAYASTVHRYIDHFGLIISVTSMVTAEAVVKDAMNACDDNIDICDECIHQHCMINALLDHIVISGDDTKETDIILHFLKLLLDLDEDEFSWLQTNPDIAMNIFEYHNFTGFDISRGPQCASFMCIMTTMAYAQIQLAYHEIDVSVADEATLCAYYTGLSILDPDAVECIRASDDFLDIIEFIITSDIVNPCDSGRSSVNI